MGNLIEFGNEQESLRVLIHWSAMSLMARQVKQENLLKI